MSMINIAFSGLQAAQVGMNVTSMNIANLLTPGTAARALSKAPSAQWGSGFYRRERGTGRQYSPHLQSVSG